MPKKLTTDEFITKARVVHGEKYDYSLVEYKNNTTKVKITCNEHGVFEQRPINHLDGCGCLECSNITTEKFIKKAKKIHGNKYCYSKVVYINNKTKVIIVCSIHGEFLQTPASHLKHAGCPMCSGTKQVTTFDFIKKAKNIHGNKYDYSTSDYKNNYTKVKIICKIHGEFYQRPYVHLRGAGCHECSRKIMGQKRITQEDFILNCIKVHNNIFDYSKTVYEHGRKKIIVTCKKHGDFYKQPHAFLRGEGCPKCKKSNGEKHVMSFLGEYNINYQPQYKFTKCKNKRELPFDFFLKDYSTCIEFHGRQHFNHVEYWGGIERFNTQNKNDKIKEKFCRLQNIPLVIVFKTKKENKFYNFVDLFNNSDSNLNYKLIQNGFKQMSCEEYKKFKSSF